MRIAVPMADGRLCRHFGHCEAFVFIDADPEKREILQQREVVPPPHQPGLLPPWLAEQDVDLVIAGGMGARAISIFEQYSIPVLCGAPDGAPHELATAWMHGTLTTGVNVCDH